MSWKQFWCRHDWHCIRSRIVDRLADNPTKRREYNMPMQDRICLKCDKIENNLTEYHARIKQYWDERSKIIKRAERVFAKQLDKGSRKDK